MKKHYICLEDLLEFAKNHVDKSVSMNDIARFPTEEVKKVIHSAWVPIRDGQSYCFNCTVERPTKKDILYCPACGARMDGKVPACLDKYYDEERQFYQYLHLEQQEQM